MKLSKGKKAKDMIRRITSHNGKLGWNWETEKGFYEDATKRTQGNALP